jgi:hypothetical protein
MNNMLYKKILKIKTNKNILILSICGSYFTLSTFFLKNNMYNLIKTIKLKIDGRGYKILKIKKKIRRRLRRTRNIRNFLFNKSHPFFLKAPKFFMFIKKKKSKKKRNNVFFYNNLLSKKLFYIIMYIKFPSPYFKRSLHLYSRPVIKKTGKKYL